MGNAGWSVCAVAGGASGAPNDEGLWDWLVLTELLGDDRCNSLHVFARSTAAFFPQPDLHLKKWLAQVFLQHSHTVLLTHTMWAWQVEETQGGKPIALLPYPENCELGRRAP